jgi:putative ABC transport system permease protein
LTKPATIVLTQETAVKYFGNEDLIEYTFLDQDFDNLMRADLKLGDLFTLFSMLAIVIDCLGLGGLASFVTVQRTK